MKFRTFLLLIVLLSVLGLSLLLKHLDEQEQLRLEAEKNVIVEIEPTITTNPDEEEKPEEFTPVILPNLLEFDNDTDLDLSESYYVNNPIDPSVSEGEGYKVLIMHTHATESYTPSAMYDFDNGFDYRSNDDDYNVVLLGGIIADILNENGIETLHDTYHYDYPSTIDSYDRSLEAAENYVEEYPTIEIIIDVHRDAFEDYSGNYVAVDTEINGETVAQLLLLVGTNQAGFYYPDWEYNLNFAANLQNYIENQCTGIMRDMLIKSSRYNQHVATKCLLLEIGTNANTLEQAIASAEIFGELLTEYLLQYEN